MKKKHQKIQIALISIGILLIFATYFYIPNKKKNSIFNKSTTEQDSKKTTINENSSSFENLKYNGMYDLDKPFTVESEKAYILNEDPDIVHMTNMYVTLYLQDDRIVRIISKKGKYNKFTYDCFFEQDVEATDGETKIYSQNLDLLATENSVKIYNDVFLDHPAGDLFADKVDYDFETKNFKVSMFEDDPVKMKVIK
ncbi:LPS export ABC transporter periplasmic protein LptC [Pelagibacteraceae bacterium]|nr:LPS export ABC transporter periplasmic protein LptC [Pelagibacteraceae bacterium]